MNIHEIQPWEEKLAVIKNALTAMVQDMDMLSGIRRKQENSGEKKLTILIHARNVMVREKSKELSGKHRVWQLPDLLALWEIFPFNSIALPRGAML